MERRNMNKNYKVVFSKARGALMVVNELTSSVQAKGTKTVIAGAVASLVAAPWLPNRPSTVVYLTGTVQSPVLQPLFMPAINK